MRAWQAVGRLETGDHGFCTATMITRRHVLTAAHCTVHPETGVPLAPEALVFRAGLRDGAFLASRAAARVARAPGYRFSAVVEPEGVANDVAVIELREPIPDAGITPVRTGGAVPEDRVVTVVSYGAGRDAAPSLQERCNVAETLGPVLVFDCDLTFGSSGAAILEIRNGRPQVLSLVSAGGTHEGRRAALGPRLGGRVDALLAGLETAPAARRVRASGGRQSIAEQLERAPRGTGGLPQIGDRGP